MAGVGGGRDGGGRGRRWDVALSFAGAQREFAEQVARALAARDVRCFYDFDPATEVELWGKHLAEHLPSVYGNQAAVVVVFVSAEYASREWTRLERRAAFSRAMRENREYVLPVRFDDTELPGLLPDVAVIDLRARPRSPEDLAGLIARKLDALGITGPALAEGRPPAPADILIPGQRVPSGPRPDDDTVRPARGLRRRVVLIAAGAGTALAVVLAAVLLILPGANPVSPGTAPGYARAVIADDPVAYWQFDAAPGPAGYGDSSGHGSTLPAGLTTLAAPGIPDLAGAISTAAGGTHTATSLSPLAGDASRTVEAWFRTTAAGCIFSAGLDAHTRGFALCLRDGPVNAPAPGAPGVYFATYDADIFIPAANLTDGTWQYLAVTLTGNTVAIVIDGTAPRGYIWDGDARMPGGGTYTPLTIQPFTLPYTPGTAATTLGVATAGIGDTGGGLLGMIAELAVYPRALPVSELSRHYHLAAG